MQRHVSRACSSILWILLWGVPMSADDPKFEGPFPFERILDGDEAISPEELWKRVIECDFELSSDPWARHGYFELLGYGDRQPGETTHALHVILDDDGSRRIQLFPIRVNLPGMIMVNGSWLLVGESSEWERYKVNWIFSADQEELASFAEPTASREEGLGFMRFILLPTGKLEPDLDSIDENAGFIRFSLGRYLSAFMSERPSTTWHAPTRTLTAVKSNGTTVQLRFRTPHDQRRFGTILAELYERTTGGGILSHRSFIVDRESPLRLNIPDVSSLAQRLGAIEKFDGQTVPSNSQLKSDAERLAAVRLQAEISYLDCHDTRQKRFPQARSRFQEAVVGAFTFYKENVVPTLETGRRFGRTDEFVDVFVQELEIGYLLIEAAITQDDADVLVDDPNILRLGLERALDPRSVWIFLHDMYGVLLASESVSLRSKIRLCTVIGEFGPASLAFAKFPVPGRDGPFLEAILHARWGWVPTEGQTSLCHAKRSDVWAGAPAREAAIDSLIRWGKLDEIPAEQMDDWFRSKLVASETHRHCTWKALTRTDSGRQFLMDRLESLEAQPEIRRDIANILCLRASATLDMQRFDFMTEQECQLTLRTCQPLVH